MSYVLGFFSRLDENWLVGNFCKPSSYYSVPLFIVHAVILFTVQVQPSNESSYKLKLRLRYKLCEELSHPRFQSSCFGGNGNFPSIE